MSKLKILLLSPFFLLLGNKIHAQHLWYENETTTENITFTRTVDGTFTKDETNPDVSGINTNTTSSKFVRDANVNRGFIYFDLYTPLTTASKYTITLKAYTDVATSDLSSEPNRLRLYLQNTTTGDFKQITKTFTIGQAWEDFSFVFDKSDFTTEGLGSGGYNQMYIGFGNGQESTSAITYYIDQIYGSIPQIPLEDVLKGSWGVRFYIRSGGTLDNYVDNLGYDYIAGAQEIIDNYPTTGHVITNATNNAKSHLWSLRTNPNVDVVMGAPNSIVDEEFVPSLEKEHIIIDVINMFKNANKKVILYLNSNDPANRATIAGAAAWNNYVDTYFAGDGHKAWMNYCEGYIKRYTELGVDGYWIDAFSSYHFGDVSLTQTEERQQKDEFIQMIRNAAPNAILGVNEDKDYFTDEDGEFLKVDSDGIDDADETDYRIIKLSATDSYSDFTAGHITPLGQGAPPNSWGYEEFTIPDVEESSSSIFEGNRALKHLFLPMRETWSNERTPLVYTDQDQAYRFAKRITDAGGAVTFSSTTSDDGTPSADEAEILTFVNQQFAINADATVYQRPEGAFLVGEEVLSTDSNPFKDSHIKLFPNPVTNSFKLSKEFSYVHIYAMTGAKILEFSGNEDDFDISHLNSGFYVIKALNKNNNIEVIKFFKK